VNRLPWWGLLAAGLALASGNSRAAEGLYRVEVLVFRNTQSNAEPREVDHLRGFFDLLDLDQPALPPAPVKVEQAGSTFRNLWNRLERLNDYEPLAMLVYEQTRADYHPPVRLHNDEVIAEELHFPGPEVYVDLTAEDMFAPYVMPLYRLDGSVQLRHTRFLHIDLDLEYRVEDPAWATAPATPLPSGEVLEGEPPEPFRIYRLKQSRQVRTDALNYFDSPFLGALVRVTEVEAGQ